MAKSSAKVQERKPQRHNIFVRRAELVVAIAITALIVFFHGIVLTHAGGLWRDEVSSVVVSTLPSLSDLWSSLVYESFPLLSYSVIRLWTKVTSTNSDAALRTLGFLIGLSVMGVVWANKRFLGISVPLLSLALFCLNLTVIRWGDSMRGYGLGAFLVILLFGLFWKLTQSPTPKRIVLATLVAVLTVQCMYQSAFLLLAIGLASCAVFLRKRMWKGIASILGMGCVAGLSLLPYLPTIKAAQEVVVVAQYPFDFSVIWDNFVQALNSGSNTMLWIWIGLFVVSILLVILLWVRGDRLQVTEKQQQLALFCLVVMVFSTAIFLLFLKSTSFPTQPWYYISLMAVIAVSLDVITGLLATRKVTILARTALALLIVGITLPGAFDQLSVRQTNVDIIASDLEKRATRSDLIVVNPYYCGVTFNRYYKGSTPWVTVPPLDDVTIHRYDLLKTKMTEVNPLQTLFARMSMILESGNRLWIVGGFSIPEKGQAPPMLPPAPNGPGGWYSAYYLYDWNMQLGHFINSHTTVGEIVNLKIKGQISPYENMPLYVFKGWRP